MNVLLSILVSSVLLLDGGWTLSREGASGRWPASVPSTVGGTLIADGHYPSDLLEGTAYKDVDMSVFDETWTYRKVFRSRRSRGTRSELVFDGLGFYADIFLNGTQIASSDTTYGVFVRRAYDVTELLKRRNRLVVKLRRAQPGDLNIGFVDWNPHPLGESMGIIRPVYLKTTGDVSIEDVYVIPDLDVKSFGSADLEVRVDVSNKSSEQATTTLNLSLDGVGNASCEVELAPMERRTVVLTPAELPMLHLESPRVWWTYDMGTPELYRLGVSATAGGKVSDSRKTTFGVRRIESRLIDGNYRQMTLNGRDVLIKGAGWTDDLMLMDTPESIERQVRYVKDMNLNLIRFENIWGKDDTVYDLCDSLGIMALVGWSCQWEWEDYCGLPETDPYGCINDPRSEELAIRYFHDQVVRLHNHPSVIAWMTGSDRIPNPRVEAAYLNIYAEQDYRPYICSAKNMCSASGWSGTKMAGPYEYVGPDYWYLDTNAGGAFGWNTETSIGAQIPQVESLRRMIPAENLWPLSEVWDYHCTASGSAMNSTAMLQKTVENQYGAAADLDDFVLKAHAVDFDSTRAMFESFRANMPRSTGIVQWMLNSAWPSLYWQLYDWYGVPAAGYYAVKKACEPVQLIFDYSKRKVVLVSESLQSRSLTATVKVFDESSALISERSADVSAGYRDVIDVFDMRAFDGKPHFIALYLEDANGRVTDNFYAIPSSANEYNWKKENWYMTPISRWADLSFAFSSRPERSGILLDAAGEAGEYAVTVTNTSGTVSFMNILKARNAAGELVVPAYWSDNFFALAPGESKTVTCRTGASDVIFAIN